MAEPNFGGNTLHAAVKILQEDVLLAQLNTQSAAMLEEKDVYGLSPLHLAVRLAEFRLPTMEPAIKMLCNAGSDVKSKSSLGRTAIEEAARFEFGSVYDLLNVYNPDSAVPRNPRDTHWATIRAGLSRIFWCEQSMKASDRAQLHGNVTDVLTRQAWSFKTLYENLQEFVADYIREVAAGSTFLHSEEFSTFYCHEWLGYKKKVKHITGAFALLDRYVAREQSEQAFWDGHNGAHLRGSGYSPLFQSEEACLILWKEHFLDIDSRLSQIQDQLKVDKGGTNGIQALQSLCEAMYSKLGGI